MIRLLIMAKTFTFDNYLDFLERHDKLIREKRPDQATDHQLFALARLAKLTEETGEVADAILSYYGAQRGSKLTKPTKSSIAHELADTYIVLGIIARHFDLDILELLQQKTAILEARHSKKDV